MNLDPNKDLEINVKDLTSEFKKLPLLLYRYYEQKADAERDYDRNRAALKEIKARVSKELRSSGAKHTEKSMEAEVDSNEDVLAVSNLTLESARTLATWIGGVESLKAKKDMLIQLGADARKE
jgi:hypothetical protein